MAKPTTIKDAIASFEGKKGVVAAETEKVDLYGICPPIEKMDNSLSALKACKKLALSTNRIEKIAGLSNLTQLEVLSLGRNLIKKIEGLEPVAETLRELWISYNSIEKLAGIEKLSKLKVLYMSNNKVKDWAEIDKLSALSNLEDLLLINNPIQAEAKDNLPQYRIEVLKRVPKLVKLDGQPVSVEEREAAAGTSTAA